VFLRRIHKCLIQQNKQCPKNYARSFTLLVVWNLVSGIQIINFYSVQQTLILLTLPLVFHNIIIHLEIKYNNACLTVQLNVVYINFISGIHLPNMEFLHSTPPNPNCYLCRKEVDPRNHSNFNPVFVAWAENCAESLRHVLQLNESFPESH